MVYADMAAKNAASICISEHPGFVRTAVHPAAFQREGQALDLWGCARSPGMKKEERL